MKKKTYSFRIRLLFKSFTLLLIPLTGISSTSYAQLGHEQFSNWFKITMMPDTAASFSLNEVDGKLYVIGGEVFHPDSGISKVSIYDIEADEWSSGARMPTARYPAQNVTIGNKIYAIGGNKYDLSSGNKMEVYDVLTDTWSSLADVPTSRIYPVACVLDGKIYVIGGFSQSDLTVPDGSSGAIGMNNVERYDPVTDVWDTVAPMPTPRFGPAVSVVEGKMYVMGGAKPNDGHGYGGYNTLEEYDPATDQWTTKDSMNYNRAEPTSVVVNNKIWAIGGAPTAGFRTVYPHFEVYDPLTDKWDLHNNFEVNHPQELAAGRAINVDGRIYIFGGIGPKTHTHPVYKDVYAYNFPTLTISSDPVIASSDSLVSEILKDCRIYIVPAGTPAKPDSIIKDSISSFSAAEDQEFRIPIDNLPYGTYRSYGVASDGLVDLNSYLFEVVEDVPDFIVQVRDRTTQEMIPASYVFLNGKRFTQSSEEGAVLTGWAIDTCLLKITADGYHDFDTTLYVNSDLSLVINLESIYLPPQLSVGSNPVLLQTDPLIMSLSETGLIYIVPEGTPPLKDSIIKYSKKEYLARPHEQLMKVPYLPTGKYLLYGISTVGRISDPSGFRIVEDVPECIILVKDEDSMELIPECLVVLNEKDTIPETDLGFELTGWAYDTCSVSITREDYLAFDTTLVVTSDTSLVIYLKSLSSGIEQRSNNEQVINIYPNPADNLVTIDTKIQDRFEIILTTLNGQLLHCKICRAPIQQLDLSSFEEGVYFISIRSKETVVTRKLFKQ